MITNNVDVSYYQRSIPYTRAPRLVTIGIVAMITPWKGQHLLIEAVELLGGMKPHRKILRLSYYWRSS